MHTTEEKRIETVITLSLSYRFLAVSALEFVIGPICIRVIACIEALNRFARLYLKSFVVGVCICVFSVHLRNS